MEKLSIFKGEKRMNGEFLYTEFRLTKHNFSRVEAHARLRELLLTL